MTKRLDVTGQRFGSLTVLAVSGKDVHGNFMWLCQCDCGNKRVVGGYRLRSGHTKSCGCLQPEAARKASTVHGGRYLPEYSIWSAMIKRCGNSKADNYERYGGRGISVCESWLNFENFFRDMGSRPTLKHSIDRIDNDKGYSKDNCRWATGVEQSANKRTPKNSSTGTKGVSFGKGIGKYVAYISIDGKRTHLGCFETIEEAAEARHQAEIKCSGR